jgi:xylulose-5-phosphate/fructose-6-phosphate phosphoketolase
MKGGAMSTTHLKKELTAMDAYWRAANYLSVGQIYLHDNPLLKKSLKLEHIKPRLLGHWGTTPGLNFIYVHLNRVIKARDLHVIYIAGPEYLSGRDVQRGIPQYITGYRRHEESL